MPIYGAADCWDQITKSDALGEKFSAVDRLARQGENAVACIVQSFGIFRPRRDVGLHHFEDEKIVFVAQIVVVQPAFKIRMTFPDQGSFDFSRHFRCELEMRKFVDIGARCITNPDDNVGQ